MQSSNLREKQELFEKIYKNINGYEVSNDARSKHSDDISHFLYGEASFNTFSKILNDLPVTKTGNFYDLGSGTGRLVILASLLGNFDKCIGVELLKGLYNKSMELADLYRESSGAENIYFKNESFLDTDLKDADFVFINHPTTDKQIHTQLEAKMEKELKKNTIIIHTIQKLEMSSVTKIYSKQYNFSWGKSTIYVYKKTK